MKVVLVTLLLVFISTSFALGVPRRFGKQISVHSLHLEKISTLGSALKGLIQLADADELAPVIEIIEEITEELQGLLNSNSQDLAVLIQQHETDEAAAQATIAGIEQSLSDAEDDLASSQQHAQDLQNAIDANVRAINDATATSEAEVQRRAAAQAAYEQHVADAQEALSDLQEAASILQEISGEDLSSSFIQLQKKKLFKSLSLIQKKLAKVNLRTSPTQAYIKQLIQVAQDAEAQGTINADLFNQIFVLVESFKESIQQEIDSTKQANQEDYEQDQYMLATLAGVVAAQQEALQDNQNQLSAVQEHIAGVEAQISTLEQNLSDAQANLQSLEETFAQQSQVLQGYINRLGVDIDVLQRALVFVQTENAQIGNAADGRNAQSFGVQASAGSDAGAGGDVQQSESVPAFVDDEVAYYGAVEAVTAPEPEVPQLDISWVTAPQEEAVYVSAVVEPVAPEPAEWQTGPAEEQQASSDEESESESDEPVVGGEPAPEESDEESDAPVAGGEPAPEESDVEEAGEAASERPVATYYEEVAPAPEQADEQEVGQAAPEEAAEESESESDEVDFL